MLHSQISVAFYNVENLFDTEDDVHTLDREFTPKGKKKWGPYRYKVKVEKLGKAISRIGEDKTKMSPALVGLAEVENSAVLNDLVHSDSLQYLPYKYIHFDSPDERGIDVALLYNTSVFEPIASRAIPTVIYDSKNVRDYTRDILYVKGKLSNETVHIFVNHWPSKRSGYDETRLKRIQIAKLIHQEIAVLEEEDPKIIMMGDFNDNPNDDSIQKHLVTENFQNPMLHLYNKGLGASKFYGVWMLFDQIILSQNFFSEKKYEYQFKEASIFDADFLKNPKGPHKNEPLRTYTGKYYQGGYSDHFPVYTVLEKKV
jgi:predicted extracellular nuclease